MQEGGGGEGNPLELVEEMHTEAPAVPIGTIEPAAQCIGGTLEGGCPVNNI